MLPSNNPDSVLENAFCCFDPSQEPNHIQRFAETLCERFWHAFKSKKFQPNLRFDSAACQKEIVSAQWHPVDAVKFLQPELGPRNAVTVPRNDRSQASLLIADVLTRWWPASAMCWPE